MLAHSVDALCQCAAARKSSCSVDVDALGAASVCVSGCGGMIALAVDDDWVPDSDPAIWLLTDPTPTPALLCTANIFPKVASSFDATSWAPVRKKNPRKLHKARNMREARPTDMLPCR